MKFKQFLKSFPVLTGAVILSLVFIIFTAVKGAFILAAVELVILIAVTVFEFYYFDVFNARKKKLLNQINGVDFLGGYAENFPMPVLVCSNEGDIIWYNSLFEEKVGGISELTQSFKEMGMDSLADSGTGIAVECEGRFFNVFSHRAKKDGRDVVVLYFTDITKYRKIADDFVRTRPAVVIMTIDNIAEIQQNYRESDCSGIRNGIEKIIEVWMKDYPCFISKVSDSKFYIVAEKQDIDSMCQRSFDVLDKVRNYSYRKKFVGATLSIGVGSGSNLSECEKNAKNSLDMALGRGGDQAVIKTRDNYEFFGGVSKSVESTSKVKSRVVASALAELIEGSENVFVMGHRFPDFDAMGSALGVSFIARSLGKNAYIITDKNASMCRSLIERCADDGSDEFIVSSDEAKKIGAESRKNLLVIVDTHIKSFVEYPDLLEFFNMPVVIDHHRKAVDFIDNSVIFFHDPSASSTAEMVTELVEYIPDVGELDSLTADGLMAGIMLDTKNFILRSTSRTFEAAAFLKSQNADTVRVRKLFANDIENQYARNRIINDAKKYRNCAVAVARSGGENIRMVSAQAADELLNISGVDASFVIFETDNAICVSARSYGAVNVQVLMEQMGGGGHQTMAAAQIKNSDIETVTADLMHGIDKYNSQKEV